MVHFLRNSKIKRPMRPSCPDPEGVWGAKGAQILSPCIFYNYTIQTCANFADVISRGIGIRELLVESILLFYGKAIVETEN